MARKTAAQLDREIADHLAKTPGQRKADELYAQHGAKALEAAEHEWATAELTEEEERALDSAIVLLSGVGRGFGRRL